MSERAGGGPSHIYEAVQGRYRKAQFNAERGQWRLFCSRLSSSWNKRLLTWSRWVKRRFVWHHTIISQSPLTRTRRNARARSTNIQHIPEHRTITHTQPHIPSPHRRSVSLFLRLTFSHCSKALCHWGTSGVRVWFPLWSLLTNRTVTAEAEVLLPEYFCLKPETLKYWFVLLACFKAGQFDIYNTWCWIPKRLLVGSIRETLYYHCSRFRSFLLYTNLHDSHLKT